MSLSRDLLKWVLSLDLAFAVKNVKRDFSNGFLFAEILTRFFPEELSMHSFENVTSSAKKKSNWILLEKLMRRKGLMITTREIDAIIAAEDDAALKLLERLFKALGGMDREPRPQTDRASSASAATSSAPHAARDVPYSAAADSVAAVTAVSHPQAAAAVNTHYNASLGAATKGKGQHASPRPPAAVASAHDEYYAAMAQAAAQSGYDVETYMQLVAQQQQAYYEYYGVDPAQQAAYYQQGQGQPAVQAYYYDASGQAYPYAYGPEAQGAAHSPRPHYGGGGHGGGAGKAERGGHAAAAAAAPAAQKSVPPAAKSAGAAKSLAAAKPSAAAAAVAAKAKKEAEEELERENLKKHVEYQPYSLKEYKEKFADREYVQLGRLGPDLDPEVGVKREMREKMRQYAAAAPKPVVPAAPKPAPAKGPTSRDKAILYAKNVPKPAAPAPAPRAEPSDASVPSPGNSHRGGGVQAREKEALSSRAGGVSTPEDIEKVLAELQARHDEDVRRVARIREEFGVVEV